MVIEKDVLSWVWLRLRNVIHPSIFFTLIKLRIVQGLQPIPADFEWVERHTLDRLPVHHRKTRQAHTLTSTAIAKLESPINLTWMSVGGSWTTRRKLTQVQGEHTDVTRPGQNLLVLVSVVLYSAHGWNSTTEAHILQNDFSACFHVFQLWIISKIENTEHTDKLTLEISTVTQGFVYLKLI